MATTVNSLGVQYPFYVMRRIHNSAVFYTQFQQIYDCLETVRNVIRKNISTVSIMQIFSSFQTEKLFTIKNCIFSIVTFHDKGS